MPSLNEGKEYVVQWVRNKFNRGSSCLDVGPSDGKWFYLLGNHFFMDAVEIYQPYIEWNGLENIYRNVWCQDIADFSYDWYDLIIFGDVIEHMTVQQAQKVIEYAMNHCSDMIVAVPFMYKQDECNGNIHEKHIQDDLTNELFMQRYPGLQLLHQPTQNYAYYVKDPKYPYAYKKERG